MKLKFKTINEGLHKVSSDIYLIDYVGTLVNLLKRQDKEYRILYDGLPDFYLMCPADSHIHSSMLAKAFKYGWYEEYKDKIDEFTIYDRRDCEGYRMCASEGYEDEDGNCVDWWMYYLVFSPNGEWSIGDDGYNHIYNLTFGDILTRDCKLEEIPDLYNYVRGDIIGSYDAEELV